MEAGLDFDDLALAAGTSFRHTSVLLTEASAAEAGGGVAGFESLTLESAARTPEC